MMNWGVDQRKGVGRLLRAHFGRVKGSKSYVREKQGDLAGTKISNSPWAGKGGFWEIKTAMNGPKSVRP